MSSISASTPLILVLPGAIHTAIAVVLAETMANWVLLGILWVQVYLYYTAFSNDYLFLKLIVFLELLLETVQTCTVTQFAFHSFTIGFSNPAVLNDIGTEWYSIPLITGLVATLTQGFYCYRAAILTKSKYAVCLIGMLSLCQLGAAIALALEAKEAAVATKLYATNRTFITIGIWGVSGLVCDTMIAAIMTYYLRKRDTGFKHTHGIITRLVRLSIETGCATALIAGLLLALVYLPGHPPYYQVAAVIMAKTYSNSMMAVLNSRAKVISNSPNAAPPCWNESQSLPSV